ncbi:DUF2294 domain-containing protein [Microcoleus sp. FACHB-68]|uniref:DUF2294 domain-containing protein n=1 Tax=Microcoleus sp. FACHB-68 TaxID=2692826 RepID=UPI001684F6B3|nr:DUF2294 domain-containing protein [Microcoleus sp. FACHB-68]MBD1937339.1 DUF2294 domain-containing protein [Microcoleus sp. FACHB-68]
MSDDTQAPTRGQLERLLSQRIQALYRTHLEHKPSKIDCQINEDKIIIVLNDSFTKAEKLLAENGQEGLAEQVHAELDEVILPLLKALIEEVLEISVLDLLSNAKLKTGRSGTIALLASTPQFRAPASARSAD